MSPIPIYAEIKKTLTEILNINDISEKLKIKFKILSETINLNDAKKKNIFHKLTETLELNDTLPLTWSKILSETLKINDIFERSKFKSKILTENIQLNDSYGKPNQIFVYVYDTVTSKWIEVEGIEYFKVTKRLNQMSLFEIDMPQIEADQKLYVKEFAKVLLISNNTLILKGRIQKVTYETSYSATIEGFGMEAVILDKEYKNITRSPEDEDRVQYTNVSAQTIAKELLSTNADGTSPWTMQPRTYGLFVNDYGLISTRYEYANKLTALGNLANSLNYDWWIDHDPITYTNDYFNMASIKGNQTNPNLDVNRQFTITGTLVNAEGTDYQKDVTNIANYVKIIGYGDGINQLFTSTYNASPIWTTLSANISATDVTIPLIDSSAFAASGTVRIANEIITYTGNAGNSLTGCARGVGTEAKAHRNGCYIEKYVVYTSPEANSSISTNGLMELTLTYRDIRDESTLELIASKELIDRMDPIERITIIPTDPNSVAEILQTGDLVSIIDAESSLNSNYRIVAIIYENNYGILSVSLEASNKSLTFIEQMQKEREKNQSLQKYMQGATNIYALSEKENCDNSNPLNMRFYIPDEAIAINKVLLKFTTQPFRAYNTISLTDPGHTHDINIGAGGSHTHSVSIGNHTHSVPGHVHGIGTIDASWEDAIGTSSAIGSTSAGSGGTTSGAGGSDTLTSGSKTHTHSASAGAESATTSITQSFGIYEDAFPTTPTVDVSVGTEGAEVPVSGSPFSVSDGGIYAVDITNLVSLVGAGNWCNIKFTPNGATANKRMRIEANAIVQIFIESK
jgi:hypothetical protein